MNQPNNTKNLITETTERIVIEYANLSGRESENRAEFRNRVTTILSAAFGSEEPKGSDTKKAILEELLTTLLYAVYPDGEVHEESWRNQLSSALDRIEAETEKRARMNR